MNIPNILTVFRILLVPTFVILFFSGMQDSLLYSMMIFFIAGFTDILDGYIARKNDLITKFGTLMDPLADKLMLLTVLTCLVIRNYIPMWVLGIIAAKDIFMIFSGFILYTNDTIIPSNLFGKVTTALFYLSIFVMLFDPNKLVYPYIINLAVLSAIAALINYFLIYVRKRDKGI